VNTIAHNLVRIRSDRNLSQGEVARLSGVSRAAISKYETGDRLPKLRTLVQIARALRCAPSDIDPDAMYREPDPPLEVREQAAEYGFPPERAHLIRRWDSLDHDSQEAVVRIARMALRSIDQGKGE